MKVKVLKIVSERAVAVVIVIAYGIAVGTILAARISQEQGASLRNLTNIKELMFMDYYMQL